MPGNNRESFWKRNLDKIGIGGSIFAALCCLGLPAVFSIVSAIGLGFLINDAVLLPLLILFLIITIGGLILGKRRHQKPHALILGTISSVALFLFIFVMYNKILAYLSIIGLIVSSILNVRLKVRKDSRRMHMKKIFILTSMIFISLQPLVWAEIHSVSLEVKGLSCPFCALGLEKQLKQVKVVEKADVHLKKGRTDLTLKPGQPFDLKAIQKAVKESGFTLENIHMEISGMIEEDQNGMLVLVSTGEKERFLLFDESHKESETKEFLKADMKDQLLSAMQAKKKVIVNGTIHGHANLPFGLMIEDMKAEE